MLSDADIDNTPEATIHFQRCKTVVTRKDHTCCYCNKTIPKGTRCESYTVMSDEYDRPQTTWNHLHECYVEEQLAYQA